MASDGRPSRQSNVEGPKCNERPSCGSDLGTRTRKPKHRERLPSNSACGSPPELFYRCRLVRCRGTEGVPVSRRIVIGDAGPSRELGTERRLLSTVDRSMQAHDASKLGRDHESRVCPHG